MPEIFLARTEEQRQFRQMLQAQVRGPWRRAMPTFAKLLPQREMPKQPRIMLLYGEGGMGKSTLLRRLKDIAAGKIPQDKAFANQIQILDILDWEEQQKFNLSLQVGHDEIELETVLAVLHGRLEKQGWGGYFKAYVDRVKLLKEAEKKVEDKIQKQPPDQQNLPDRVLKGGAKLVATIIRNRAPEVAAMVGDKLEPTMETAIRLGAEGLHQVNVFVQRTLKGEELEIYRQPGEKLAEALGLGLAKLAATKPVLLLLDT